MPGRRLAYSGHPVAAAVAVANIKLIQQLRLVEHVRDDVGPYLAEHFESLREHPLVGDVDHCGMMAGLLLVKDKAQGTPFPSELEVGMVCRGHCFGNGLIMRAVGDRMIIAPPLVMNRSQIDELMALVRKCLDLTPPARDGCEQARAPPPWWAPDSPRNPRCNPGQPPPRLIR